jgi:nucleoid DNA-binding protein
MDRRDLRDALQDAGFTYRDARRIVSAIIDAMKTQLKRGTLDLPFGTITLERRVAIRAIRFGRISRIYRRPKATFRKKD